MDVLLQHAKGDAGRRALGRAAASTLKATPDDTLCRSAAALKKLQTTRQSFNNEKSGPKMEILIENVIDLWTIVFFDIIDTY